MHKEVREELRVRLKLTALEYAKHFGVTQTCREFKIPRSTFYGWKQKYDQEGRSGLYRKKPVAQLEPGLRPGLAFECEGDVPQPVTESTVLEVDGEYLASLENDILRVHVPVDHAVGLWSFTQGCHYRLDTLRGCPEGLLKLGRHFSSQFIDGIAETAPTQQALPVPDVALEPLGGLPASGEGVQPTNHHPPGSEVPGGKPFCRFVPIDPAHQGDDPSPGYAGGGDPGQQFTLQCGNRCGYRQPGLTAQCGQPGHFPFGVLPVIRDQHPQQVAGRQVRAGIIPLLDWTWDVYPVGDVGKVAQEGKTGAFKPIGFQGCLCQFPDPAQLTQTG